MSRNGQEILYEGWLTKSPPTKRIFRGRWRRRWFTLHPGEIPGQYILSYYTDRKSRKLKGSINLDQCEQVDKGFKFEDKKFKFDFMFDIKTPTRTYYLAADTESEMKSWVQCICRICGLSGTSDEEELEGQEDIEHENPPASPNASPISTSPYILVSECITGKTPVLPNQNITDFNALLQHNMKSYYGKPKGHIYDTYDMMVPTYLNFDPKSYDIPRNLNPPHTAGLSRSQEEINYYIFDKKNLGSPLQSPTDTESVFTDDDWSHNLTQSEHSIKYSRPSNSSTDLEMANQRIQKLSIDNTKIPELSAAAPPRPPKPPHIGSPSLYYQKQSNKNIKSDGTKSGNHSKSNSTSEEHQNFISDEMYDFPRSHNVEADVRGSLNRRHCYNNAAPGTIFTYDSSPKPSTSSVHIFRYGDEISGEPASPMSQDSSASTAQYSNLPSPVLLYTKLMPPPKVNRGLKPKRKLSDSHSISSNTEPASPQLAPSVDRKLKPPILRSGTMPTSSRRRESDDDNMSRKYRAAPSPTTPSLGRSYESLLVETEQIYHSFPDLVVNKKKILEYLDLDLESKSNNARHSRNSNDESLRSPGANTVYKKVDFMKTEAFNNTRNDLEKERNKTVPLLMK